ncbi:hypothetical protein [Treponema phagedenis]|uniref:Outer membrane protein n=1 Tax=Treponema phagedenis TaxID=162 RepID=A0AAE6M8T3_TREPH|nr:hypothetical protein [Treponema phagedenis]QEJ99375.1 hypothetical protein FUT82_16210 [Treponema phagedenis]QEK07435.1 hypothetical protein FUT80_12360 [Treponema phagedenis]QSH95348.1 hypothetical protein C5O78_10020 [Treponema phagedenis]
MKKKLLFMLALFCIASFAFAKQYGINVEAAAAYTYHEIYSQPGKDGYNYGGRIKGSRAYNVGALELGLGYDLPKKWGIYWLGIFGFPSTVDGPKGYIIDSHFGFGYNFPVAKKFTVFCGGGLAVGGSRIYYSNVFMAYTNIGIGLKATGQYMFTDLVGFYFGLSENLLFPVVASSSFSGDLSRFVQSLNAKLGLRFHF